MKKLHVIVAALLAASTLSGCIIAVGDTEAFSDDDSHWREREEANKREISHLSIGRGIDSVVANMGPPDISEAFARDGKTFKVYYYRTHQVHSDNRTTKDEATPLVFVDGLLVGWGEAAMKHATVN